LGFVRVSVQRTGGRVSPAEAGRVLAGMLASLGARHSFLPDDQRATDWPDWCQGAGQTTDAHLVSLATRHQAKLATLDRAIPDAFVIPLELH
jgi:predicted nucleic acid-binding protein